MIQSKNRDVASRRRRRPNLQKQTDGICMVAFSSSHVLFLLILSLLGFLNFETKLSSDQMKIRVCLMFVNCKHYCQFSSVFLDRYQVVQG